MTRHSFIQMSKLSNVRGRISYITSHAKQENLYAVYRTAGAGHSFWSNLARESQQEFTPPRHRTGSGPPSEPSAAVPMGGGRAVK